VVWTSINVNGYCPGFGTAACRTSIPVGPLEGKLAHPVKTAVRDASAAPLRNKRLRRATQEIRIAKNTLKTVR